MIDRDKSVHQPNLDGATRDTVERFIRAFQQRDASVIADLVAEDCAAAIYPNARSQRGARLRRSTAHRTRA